MDKQVVSNQRTLLLKKNVYVSLLVKAVSILISFVIVPLTIDFVSPVQYGIWLTISSIAAWISFFDIGFSNGLRNRLAEAIGVGDSKGSRMFVSTTYAVLIPVFLIVAIALLVLLPHINITALLKVDATLSNELVQSTQIVVCYFCLLFIVKTLGVIFMAHQQPSRSALFDMLGQLLSLITILVLKQAVEGSLIVLAISLSLPPLLVWLGANLYYFGTEYKYLRPSVSSVNFAYTRKLFGIGSKFFVIQMAAIIQYQTSNVLIARYFSMQEVTNYNISYKYFNIIFMVYMILLSPFWSSSTDAFVKKDFEWIRTTVKRYLQFFALFTLAGLVMLLLAQRVYVLWIGEGVVTIPFILSMFTCLYFVTQMISSIYVFFLNGVGALRIQFIASLFSPFVFLLLVYIFCDLCSMGVYAILLASILANFNGLILAPLQYYMIIIRNKQGIWSRQ